MQGRSFVTIAAAAIILMALAYSFFTTPAQPETDPHPALVTKARAAFCNCIAYPQSDAQSCLASAETGDGRAVTDQEILVARCPVK